MIMLKFTFLPLFLCSQYGAGTPVSSSVYSQEAEVWLRLHIVPATWAEAALQCQLEGGLLATPATSALAKTMRNAIADNKLASNGVFIGVTALHSKGDYYKSLDGTPVADIPLEWAAGEPNNADNAEHCLALTGAGALADVSCSSVLPYFCRIHVANKEFTHVANKEFTHVASKEFTHVANKEFTHVANKEFTHVSNSTTVVPPCNGKEGYVWEPRTGSCYKFHGAAKEWLPALQTCHAEGGHLAIINNKTESTVLKEMYNKNLNEVAGTDNPNVFYSGFMKWFNGEWVTVHGATLAEAGYNEWSPGEPNNAGGRENCGTVFPDGLLNDVPCTSKFSYFCEITP